MALPSCKGQHVLKCCPRSDLWPDPDSVEYYIIVVVTDSDDSPL